MQPLNLAQAKLLQRAQCRDHANRSIRTGVLLVAVTIVVGIATTGARSVMRGKTARARSELRQADSRLSAIKRDMGGIEAGTRRYRWQSQLASVTTRWMRVLDSITGSATSEVWLRRVQVADNGSSLSLEGSAASYQALATFSDRLRAEPDLSQVTLRSSKTLGTKGGDVLDFVFDIVIRAAESDNAGATGGGQSAAPKVPGAG